MMNNLNASSCQNNSAVPFHLICLWGMKWSKHSKIDPAEQTRALLLSWGQVAWKLKYSITLLPLSVNLNYGSNSIMLKASWLLNEPIFKLIVIFLFVIFVSSQDSSYIILIFIYDTQYHMSYDWTTVDNSYDSYEYMYSCTLYRSNENFWLGTHPPYSLWITRILCEEFLGNLSEFNF